MIFDDDTKTPSGLLILGLFDPIGLSASNARGFQIFYLTTSGGVLDWSLDPGITSTILNHQSILYNITGTYYYACGTASSQTFIMTMMFINP